MIAHQKIIRDSHAQEHDPLLAEKLCECGCGKPTSVITHSDPKRGYIKGRFMRFVRGHRLKTTHGMTGTPEFKAFYDAKYRCTRSNHASWGDYGGRGIEFRFTSFEEFLGHIGLKPSAELTLDRINNDGHYEIGNVRWAPRSIQNKTKRYLTRFSADDISGMKALRAQGWTLYKIAAEYRTAAPYISRLLRKRAA